MNIKEFVDGKVADLRSIIDARFSEIVHRMDYRNEVAQTAIKEAKSDLGSRLASMNEFRNAMKDQAALFVTRTEIEDLKEKVKMSINRPEHDSLCSRLSSLELKLANTVTTDQFDVLKGKIDSGRAWQVGLLVAVIVTLISVILDMSGVKI